MPPVLVVIAGFALLAVLLALSRWLAGRRWAAAGHLLLACIAAAVAVHGRSIADYLDGYEVRAADGLVAQLFFERAGPDRYRAALTRLPQGWMQVFELSGDQWRLDLRTLEWSADAARLGLEPRVRIERLVSQGAPAATGVPIGTTHALVAEEAPPRWLREPDGRGRGRLASGRVLEGPWEPMADGARFEVRLSATNGVEVEPLNDAAADSLGTR